MNKKKVLEKAMILKDISYHDAVITEAYKDGNDYVLKFKDGWNTDQINELRFINADTFFEYELVDRTIFQFSYIDYVTIDESFDRDKFIFEIYVWYKGNLTEVVNIEASNIIIKIYNKDDVRVEELLNVVGNKK